MSRKWFETTLGDLFQVKHGFAFKGEFFAASGEYVLLTPGNFQPHGGLQLRGEREKFYVGSIPSEFILKTGDLLIAMTDLTQKAPILGSPAFIPSDDRYLHNQRLGKVIALDKDRILPRFLFYLMNTASVRGQIKGSATGSTVRHTSPSRIGEVKVTIPTVATQRKIASILSAYDDLIENNTRRVAILEEMAQSLYREWFVEFHFPGHGKARFIKSPLGRIPEGWECSTIGDLCCLMRAGGTPERKNDAYWLGGSIDWYKTKELLDCFLFGSEELITEVAATESTTRMFGPGTLLMAIYGSPTVGRMGILTKQSACNQAALAMVPNPAKATLPFLYHTLLHLRSYFNTIAAGAAQQNISKAKVESAQCVLPPLDLIQQCDLLCGTAFEEIRCLSEKTLNLRTTRDLLLPKLISGQVDVEDLDIDIGESLAEADA